MGFKTADQKIFNFHSDEEFEDPKILQKCGIKGDCAMAYKYVDIQWNDTLAIYSEMTLKRVFLS